MTDFTLPFRIWTAGRGRVVWSASGLENTAFIASADDLAKASTLANGVYTLEDRRTYIFGGIVDLNGGRIVCGQSNSLFGYSPENCMIKSTGLVGTALLTATKTLTMNNLGITADVALNLDGTGDASAALDWNNINFVDCGIIGTVKSYTNFVGTTIGCLNSAGWTFDGTMGTISFFQSIFNGVVGVSSLILASTLTVLRRFRVTYSAFPTVATGTGIEVQSGASIPGEGFILGDVNFSGAGTYVSGATSASSISRWKQCRGIANSAVAGYITMNGNATATAIANAGVAVKIAGITTDRGSERFTATNNRLTYTGSLTRSVRLIAVLSMSSGNGNLIGVYIAKNGAVVDFSETYATMNAGGRAENVTIQGVLSLTTNDYLEIWVENANNTTAVTVESLSVTVVGEV